MDTKCVSIFFVSCDIDNDLQCSYFDEELMNICENVESSEVDSYFDPYFDEYLYKLCEEFENSLHVQVGRGFKRTAGENLSNSEKKQRVDESSSAGPSNNEEQCATNSSSSFNQDVSAGSSNNESEMVQCLECSILVKKRSIAVNSASAKTSEATRPWQEIPGPSSLPIIGQLHHFLPGRELSDLSKLQDLLCNKYGPIVRLDGLLGKPPMILLFHSESCATVLRSENWMPIRPGFSSLEYFRKTQNKTKGQLGKPTGLITDHGDNWKQVRSMVNPVMLQPKTIKLYAAQLDEVAQDMIDRMRSIRDENNKLKGEFDTEMNLWALESISVVALGGRLHCLNRELAEDSQERRLIQCVHDIFQVANELDFKPSLWRYFPTRGFRKGMKLYAEQENLTKYFIRKAIDDLKTRSYKSDEEKGVLEKLLAINEDIAILMASDMLFAGVDTAATTVTGTLYLLAANPEKQEKLRKQLACGDEQYLKACLKESLRILPVTAGNMRQSTKEYNILGYTIPKDMFVIFSHQYLSVLESEFPRAKEFIPERWIDKESPIYYASAHPFAYSPFGFGVRSCIGRRIAELEMHTFVKKVIQNFQVEWTGPPPKVRPASLNYLTGPFNFTFKDV